MTAHLLCRLHLPYPADRTLRSVFLPAVVQLYLVLFFFRGSYRTFKARSAQPSGRWCSQILQLIRLGLIAAVLGLGCFAQTSPNTVCALSLPDLLGELHHEVPEERIVALIAGCHINFALDLESLERLSQAGISDSIMKALNQDTICDMTLAQARAEVAVLEKRVIENETSTNAERDAELQKLDSDYELKRKKLVDEPKTDIFETNEVYERRKQRELQVKAQEYNAERSRRAAAFADALNEKNRLLKQRVEALKNGLFKVEGTTLKFSDYLADENRLIAAVNGKEYWFTVDPDRARKIHSRWNERKVMLPYQDDEKQTLYIAGGCPPTQSTDAPLPGASAAAIRIASALAQAQAFKAKANYLAAIDEYDVVLRLDPNNQTAKDERSAALATRDEVTKAAQQRLVERQAGYFVDPNTKLMWRIQDNGVDINWSHAFDYCRDLRTAGFTNWRLPTRDELTTIFHSDSRSPIRIAGGINLTSPIVWSGSKHRDPSASQFSPESLGAWSVDFVTGTTRPYTLNVKTSFRALCVRLPQ